MRRYSFQKNRIRIIYVMTFEDEKTKNLADNSIQGFKMLNYLNFKIVYRQSKDEKHFKDSILVKQRNG
ncbi:hypothetical protein BAQ49_05555 [Bacillus proteolyticus]|uniref:Uncharacterized protein n=2 Tax=Bacillus proteolyticus TaxID=2026192 RepID=A0AA44KWI1_9BACI|nr:hypothetical protein BAQ49_05555 [Bacillus proteolyticus]